MTNRERVEAWHKEWLTCPDHHWGDRIDWSSADEIARRLDEAATPEPESCPIAGEETQGKFYCSRQKGHEGPCAAHPLLSFD
jgi:hypothetical protein